MTVDSKSQHDFLLCWFCVQGESLVTIGGGDDHSQSLISEKTENLLSTVTLLKSTGSVLSETEEAHCCHTREKNRGSVSDSTVKLSCYFAIISRDNVKIIT